MRVEGSIREKYQAVLPSLDEFGRRRWVAVESRSLGHGGIQVVHRATGLAAGTIRRGIQELDSGVTFTEGRRRRAGGGRKTLVQHDAKLLPELLKLVEPTTQGIPKDRYGGRASRRGLWRRNSANSGSDRSRRAAWRGCLKEQDFSKVVVCLSVNVR